MDFPSQCIETATVSPGTIGPAGGAVTMTVTLSAQTTATSCVQVLYVNGPGQTWDPTYQEARGQLSPVAGQPRTYTGAVNFPAHFVPGTYGLNRLVQCDTNQSWDTAGRGIAPIAVTGPADSTAPTLTGLTLPPVVDGTTSAQPVAIKATVADAGVGVHDIVVTQHFVPTPGADPLQPAGGGADFSAIGFTLTSGTPASGTWTANFPISAGFAGRFDLGLVITDFYGNQRTLSTSDLVAAGQPSSFTEKVTAPPVTPTGVTGKTVLRVQPQAVVTWSTPAGTPVPVASIVTSASASCGVQTQGGPTSLIFVNRRLLTLCTVKFQVINGAGRSPVKSVTFL